MTPEQLNEIKKRLSTYHEAKATCDKDDVRVTIPRDQLIDDTAALVEQVDNLAHELKCSNETIDMLYQRSSNFAQQADTHEAEAKRLKEIVETYDDRFASLYDEKGKEIAWYKERSLEFDEFALAIGYAERPEGQSGVHRMSGPQLVEVWKAREKALDEAHDELRHIHGEYTLANTGELTRDGMAMAVAALKQQVDVLQKGRLDAEIARANAERRYDNLRSKVLTASADLAAASAPEET